MQPNKSPGFVLDSPEACFKRGIACMENGEYADAENCFRQTMVLAPESLETLLNLGYCLDLQGYSGEALDCYESVLALSPGNAKARYNRAAHLLRRGDMEAGFADYEARFEAIRGTDSRSYTQPRWDGSSLKEKSILVYAEQGLGDAIMFGRYVPLLAELGGRVVLELQPPLMRLLSSLHGVERIVAKSDLPPLTDFHVPLLSLPHLLKTTIHSIPNDVPYFDLPAKLVASWRERMGVRAAGIRVGLVWAGKEKPYPNRSCPPRHLALLLSMPGTSFFSLQAGEKDRFPLPEELASSMTDLTHHIVDLADTAALIANLDLVITIDTSVAHLAGAMGKPVWVMLPHAADWRWMLDRSDSPWYPTMRLFRQLHPGDWDSVVDEIAMDLLDHFRFAATDGNTDVDTLEARFQEALACIDRNEPELAIGPLNDLLTKLPDNPAIWFNLGRASVAADRYGEAERCFRKALLLSPDSPSIWLRMGEVLLKRNSFAEAEACLQKAHRLAPESIDILLVLGASLLQQGKNDDAFDCCRKMLAIDPECVEARYNSAQLQLRSGDYQAGFASFEARLAMSSLQVDGRSYSQPRWDGSPLEGRSILVFGEQGLGDVIQFSRYLPLLAGRGGRVILEVDPPLIPLFTDFPGVSEVVPKSATAPRTDVYVQLLSLPYFFGTTLETVPNKIPYLVPDGTKVAGWRQLLESEAVCRIGLVWRGNPRNPMDQERSCPLADFAPLTSLPGARFYSLQVGEGADKITSSEAGMELVDLTGRLRDLSDTAAFIAGLDLVIGVDTAVVHLAGAMGKPVWILLSHAADWRWIVGRQDSPWYPTARLFRQERRGDWDGVITRVRDTLEQWLGKSGTGYELEEIESLYAMGSRFKEDGDLSGAEHCFRQIIGLAPDLPDPHHSLGVVVQMQGRPGEAIAHYKEALAKDPCFVQALYNLANAFLQSGQFQDAIETMRAVLRQDAAHADAHWQLGMLLLLAGDYREGWAEYEWRWQAGNFLAKIPELGRPQWDGSPLEGRTLLIQMEQGRGDMIQFVRFAPLAAARGGRVVVRTVPELVSLMSNADGVSLAVDQNGPMPDFDVHIPAMSLPLVLGTTLESLPAKVPYLRPDPRKVDAWRREMPADGRVRIGLAWQGASENRDNANRSCALDEFLPLADLEGVVFYSLQIGEGSEQVTRLAETLEILDISGRINDYEDTAALMENLDLVISVCTSVTHLAGALGRPAWTLLHTVSDWRWLLNRDDSPWYPAMRLFRQTSQGDWRSVIARVRQELAQMLSDREFHNRRGVMLLRNGETVSAELAFARALTLDPDFADAYSNRGAALDAQDRREDALVCFQSALRCKPDFLQPLFNMGNVHRFLGTLDQACACYRRVLELKPDFVPPYLCLGEIAKESGEFGRAREYYDQALAIDASCTDAIQGLAEISQAEERYEDAISAYREVLARQPDRAPAWNLLGTAYHSLERLEEAESCYLRALELLPDQSTVLNNLGAVLIAQGRPEEACSLFRRLLTLDAEYAEGHWNLSVALLASGAYPDGWREYEWRFRKVKPVPERTFPRPRWDGTSLEGKTILLHAEQGFGDTIQFVRYAPLLAQHGGRVIIECQVPALKRLLLSADSVSDVIVAGEPLPDFDCHLPMMSLPLLFGTDLSCIPATIPYLFPRQEDVELWRSRLEPSCKFKVGLVWYAKQNQVLNRKRSCPLRLLAPLWGVPGIEFYSLQIGVGTDQIGEFASDHELIDLTDNIRDFADTAAFMKNLDLVITIDTVTAHLAGALGIRTWVVLPHVAEWRWLSGCSDSPWYPGMRLFRQSDRGDWPGLMETVAAELGDLVHGQRESCSSLFATSVAVPPKSVTQNSGGIRVGLAWSGRQDNPLNRKRSCPFTALAPLFDLPGVTYVNLQLDVPDGLDPRLFDLTDKIRDFEDTAALMANLDLIISIDTSVAHLAAATGRPTWILLAHVSDWRWLLDRSDNPWYPNMRLFRQPDHGDWDSLIREVVQQLAELSGAGPEILGDEIAPSVHRNGRCSVERRALEHQLEKLREHVRLNASSPDAHLDLGASLALLGRYAEAADSFRHVLKLENDHIGGHLNLAYSLLALGEYSEGWRHFEWRLKRIPPGQLPPWPILGRENLGTHPPGTSVMVHCEQGYGDTIQFSRFLPLLADAGYRVIVSCQSPVAPLVASICGVSNVVRHGETLPCCELQIPLLSLPGIFATTLDSIPVNIPYLLPRSWLVETWKERVNEKMCQR